MSLQSTPDVRPLGALVALGWLAAACSPQPSSGPSVGSTDNPLLAPAVFTCQASCLRPNGDTKDITWRECALDGRLAEENAPAQCALWKPDAVVNNFAFCEQVRRPPICDQPGHENDCDCNVDRACELPRGNCWGDPHMTTIDGLKYEFQPIGEFIYATDNKTYTVQMRTAQVGTMAVSIVNALAIGFKDGSKISLSLRESPMVRINDLPAQFDCRDDKAIPAGLLCKGSVDLPNGAAIHYDPAQRFFLIDFPDRISHLNVYAGTWMNTDYFNSQLFVGPSLLERTVGLMGTPNHNPADDFVTRDGRVLQQPLSWSDVYRKFGDSWRISDAESLFTYGPGASTRSFSDANFPLKPMNTVDLPAGDRQSALNICVNAGVHVDELQSCALDVALLGPQAVDNFLKGQKF